MLQPAVGVLVRYRSNRPETGWIPPADPDGFQLKRSSVADDVGPVFESRFVDSTVFYQSSPIHVAEYLDPGYSGGAFRLFGTSHLVTILFFAIIGLFLIRAGQRGDEKHRRAVRYGLATVLLVSELSWHIWNAVYGSWVIQTMLPLHMCSIMIWIAAAVLVAERRSLYPLLYFFGVAGAMQALITPDAGLFGYPHFRFFQTMIAHGALVIAGLWVVMVEKYRPTSQELVVLLVGLNVYAAIVYGINIAIGSNYLYVVAKPEVASLMDYFPGWPWYIIFMEILAIGVLWLLYLPFARARLESVD